MRLWLVLGTCLILISSICGQQSPRYHYGYGYHQRNRPYQQSYHRHRPRPRRHPAASEFEEYDYEPRQLDYSNYRDRQIALQLQAKAVEDQGSH